MCWWAFQNAAEDCDGGKRDHASLPPPEHDCTKENERKAGRELAARHDAVDGGANNRRQRKGQDPEYKRPPARWT
jgi:hypothetical protein